MSHNVTLILGDGIGPEIAKVTQKVIDATGVKINWEEVEAGIDVMAKEGTPLPEKTLESCRKNKVALKAPVTTPVGTGFRSVNVALRQQLGLYACVRPEELCMLKYNKLTKTLEQDEFTYSLQDPDVPNLYRDIYSYGSIPKIPFNHRVVPMNPPEEIWITDTTFRDS